MSKSHLKGKKIMKIILGIIIAIILLLLLSRFIAQKFIYYTATKDMEISEIQEVSLNGITQKILVEEKTDNLPIMIMVHGGPGLPIPFGVGFRGQFPQLTEKFLLVQWDQYGTGKNYSTNSTLTIDDYTKMLQDLITYIKDKYPNKKLFLYGMSWGTILNTKVANQIPEKIDGVIAYGQVTNITIWKNAMFEKLKALDLSTKERNELEKAMSDTSNESFKTVLDLASNKTSIYYYKGDEASNWDFYMHSFHVLISPDYTMLDAIHAYSNPSGDALMYNHVVNTDMTNEQLSIQVPFLMLQGEDDLITPVVYNEELVTKNKYMSLKVFKNAGHIPTNNSYEEMFNAINEFKDKVIGRIYF